MKYRTRIKCKQFVLSTSRNAKKYVKKITGTVTNIIEKDKTFYTTISDQIKQALDYGLPEVRYYIYNDVHYTASIESEYKDYHGESADDITYEVIFDVMVNTILPNKFNLYSDISIETNENQYGKYFEIKLLNI